MPDEWQENIRKWIKINSGKKKRLHGFAVPDRNDEYFLYQILIGAWPFSDVEYPEFIERIKRYIVKAVRRGYAA
jgi:(1->4)-alpha-D-glucan 1-alpha-D-glucosylmutase